MKYYILHNGGKIYYSDSGMGSPVILIHGHLESSEIWERFAGRLSALHRVISVDLPGHGRSAVYGDCHTTEFMAEAVKSLLDSLGIRKAFLIGHSMGGYVTLAFLELFPELLTGYCLFHSHPFADTPETIQKRENEIKIVQSGKKYLMYPENISRMFATMNMEKFREALQNSKNIASRIRDEGIIAALNGMMIRPDRVSVMEKGSAGCLWILGRHDNYIPFDQIHKRVKLPANARIAILENSGHLGFIEEEDQSFQIVTEFIRDLQNG
ncbi:MAG TPA: alpha/beta hydrolase [Bacteroidales bacterium]|jgi:pimeloyl-ACP methyl ester carboxylesterase|nr:alpha/beta fold hydrolase [Bacteroidales bacterium]HNR41146.1 alpha/beta hydrolase [Bacteroidales bacterium]HPM17835.1 alpha/beta hydrolase [Bacteroidales bacterium]HQH24729.1 alpha/beta hydrolase [Bacteroidales bacterium]